MTNDEIAAIEAIKILKARYCRFMDTRDWDGYASLFTENGTIIMDTVVAGPDGDGKPWPVWQGRERIRRDMPTALLDGETVHHAVMPEIELTSPTTANGIWALHDIFQSRDYQFHGCGYYYETYILERGKWLIASLHLKWVYTKNVSFGVAGRPVRDR